MAGRETVGLHWAWQMPVKALCALVLAVGVTLFDDYLSQKQEYLLNYRVLIYVLVLVFAVVVATQALLYPLLQRSVLLPVLHAVSCYMCFYQMLDWGVQWWGFAHTPVPEYWMALICLGFFAHLLRQLLRQYLRQSALRQGMLLGMLPVLLLTTHSYLAHHDYFSQRPGSYPEYHTRLYHKPQQQGQSIHEFFGLTK